MGQSFLGSASHFGLGKLPAVVADNFLPEEKLNYLEHIEESISLEIENKIKESNTCVALSGGVDSTLVMSLLRKTKPDIKIDAISLKFADSVDETKIAGNIANKFNADHHIISIENFLEYLPKAISIIKMPFWDTHWFHMVKTASKISSSLVSGDGGDELFGGYTFRYKKFLTNFNSNMTPLDKTKLYLECHERDWVPDQDQLFDSKANFSWDEIYSKIIPYLENCDMVIGSRPYEYDPLRPYEGQNNNFKSFDIDIEKLSVTNDVRVILTFDCDAANNWTLLNETFYRIRDGIPDYLNIKEEVMINFYEDKYMRERSILEHWQELAVFI